MTINSSYTNLANTMWRFKNPNSQAGTLLIELPADVGRAYSGYKRGGIIEGSEKFRKEVMSAAVWLFGIPVFNKLGNFACEKLLKIPMDIDYSNAKDGKDAIRNSIEYLADQTKTKGLDVSELKKYVGKFKIDDIDKTVKQIKGSKQAISIAAWAINCILMGVVLPRLNQKITRKKLKENANEKTTITLKAPSIEEYQKETRKNNNISFGRGNFAQTIAGLPDLFTYGINTNNTCRLVSTDVPMIIGRCATARNKYEALEIGIMDTLAIYFYNFSLGHVEKLLRKVCPTPDVNPRVAEFIANLGPEKIKEAIEKINLEGTDKSVEGLFGQAAKNEIYKQATFGKYGKINRFVKNDELKSIDRTVEELLKFIDTKGLLKNNDIDTKTLVNFIRKTNIKGAAFYGAGIVASFLGLGVLIPKIAYAITKHITGKDGFIAIEEENKK